MEKAPVSNQEVNPTQQREERREELMKLERELRQKVHEINDELMSVLVPSQPQKPELDHFYRRTSDREQLRDYVNYMQKTQADQTITILRVLTSEGFSLRIKKIIKKLDEATDAHDNCVREIEEFEKGIKVTAR